MTITTSAIADLLEGTVEGDPEATLTGFGKIEEAGPGELTFISNPHYAHYIHTTKATAVLVNRDFQPGQPDEDALSEAASRPAPGTRGGVTLIRVENSYSALARLLEFYESLKPAPEGIEQPCYVAKDVNLPQDVYVGAFAYIGAGATIGRGVKIYPQAYIGPGVTLGDGTIVRAGVKIYEGCTVGRQCILHSGCVIGADGFGFAPNAEGEYEKIPQIGNVVIEDYVEIGANTCVDRATFGSTVIGRGTKLDNLIQMAHNVRVGKNNVFAAQTGVAGSTVIGSDNRIGGQCGFAGHITIGDHNEFGAQTGIPNHVGDGKRLIGYPAVEARQFARTQVYLKRLPELFKK